MSYGGVYASYKEFEAEQYLLTPETLKFFAKCLGPHREDYKDKFGIINADDFSGLPKCCLIAVELDPLVDDSKEYAKKLLANNIPCTLDIIPGTIHGYFSQPVAFKDAFQKTEDLIAKFFLSI